MSGADEKQTKSAISLTSSRVNVNCTEIGRVRHIVKRRLTALSFTTGLVIRISHDEAPHSPQPLTLLQPVCFIWLQKGKKKRWVGGVGVVLKRGRINQTRNTDSQM